ncbi:hypothetical protein MVEG_05928 [Podila verticillata NRRL 6337]|nr:hypothetical protein MVEG_05928 [Podila verticillata NRRL 6337]
MTIKDLQAMSVNVQLILASDDDDDDRQTEQEEGGFNEYDAMTKDDYALEYTMVKARNRHHSLHARRRSE